MFKALLSTSLILAALESEAQTAQDYFHRGAQFYIWNQKQRATNEIYSGLKLFPNDPQLNSLAALFKKEQEQQQQQQKQQQQDQKNDQSKQDKDQKQQDEQNQKQDQQQNSDQKDQQKQDQQQKQAAKQDQEQKNQQAGQPEQQDQQAGATNQQQYADGQMTPDQARQLLDSQKGDEKLLPAKPEGERRKRLRDW